MASSRILRALRAAIDSVLYPHSNEIRIPRSKPRGNIIEPLERRTHLDSSVYFDQEHSAISGQYEGQTTEVTARLVGYTPYLGVDYGDDSDPNTFDWIELDPNDFPDPDHVSDEYFSHYYDDNAEMTLRLSDAELLHDEWSIPIYNVQPDATFSATIGSANVDFTLHLTSPSDPSTVDTNEGFRYTFANTHAGLNDTYNGSSTGNSQDFSIEDEDGVAWGRIFDKDGGYTDFNTQYILPTVNWTEVHHNSVRLSWNDVATNETGWIIQRAPDVSGSPGTFTTIANLDENATELNDTGRAQNTRYWYRVRAEGTPGTASDTAWSAKRAITTPIKLPTPTVTLDRAYGSTTVNLDWADQAGVTFNVYRGTFSNFPISGLTPIYSGPNGEYADTSSKTPKSRYYYTVVATKSGCEDSDQSQEVRATIPGAAPIGLQAFVVSGTEVQLYWDAEDSQTGFFVYRATTSSVPIDSAHRVSGTNPIFQDHFEDTTVSANTTYYYAITSNWPGVGSGTAESLPATAVEADTSTPYAPDVNDDPDYDAEADAQSQRVITGGSLQIPLYDAHGALHSISLIPPDSSTPFAFGPSGDYYGVVNATEKTVDLSFRPGPFIMVETRIRGSETYTEVVSIMNDSYLMGIGPISWYYWYLGFSEMNGPFQTVPVPDLILISSETGAGDPGGANGVLRSRFLGSSINGAYVACSPNPDPPVMRVFQACKGKEILNEFKPQEASVTGADHRASA